MTDLPWRVNHGNFAGRGTAILLSRDPYGWRSHFIAHKGEFRDGISGYSSGSEYSEAYASALMSLAQDTWDGSEEFPPCLDECRKASGMMARDNAGRRLLGEFTHWRGFQLAYRHAKANGIGQGDCDWHRWACEHTSEFASKPAA